MTHLYIYKPSLLDQARTKADLLSNGPLGKVNQNIEIVRNRIW